MIYIFGPQEIDVVKFWKWHSDQPHFALQLARQLHNVLWTKNIHLYIYIYIYIYTHTHTHTHTHIVHLRQECQNSKFCIFELLVQKETFAGALLTGIAAQRSLQNSPLESSCVVVALRILQHFKIFKRFSWKTANFELWHYYRKGAIYILKKGRYFPYCYDVFYKVVTNRSRGYQKETCTVRYT